MVVPMTSSRSLRRRLAWAVPAGTAGAVAAAALFIGGVLPTTAAADPHPTLDARTPAQLLAAVQSSDAQALSGTIVQTARLGLPTLPGSGTSAALSWQNLVTGTHTLRVWVDGPDRQRVALLGQLEESDVVHDGRQVWTYSSQSKKVGTATLPKGAERPDAAPDATSLTPQALADKALAALDPSTVVSVDATQVVAGRPAYTLVLAPRDTRSTVRRVQVAVDAATSVPLRVQVFGVASAAALESGFTQVSFARPAASVFAFSPPKGSIVGPIDLSGRDGDESAPDAKAPDVGLPGSSTPDAKGTAAQPVTHGTGWTTVVEIATGPNALASLGSVADKLTTSVPGGRLLSTSLVNALLTDDGRLFVGAVSPAVLQQTAAG